MLAEAMWRLGEVLTGTLAIDHQICSSAVALAGNLGCPICLQRDIASQDQLCGAIDPASTLWQLAPGLVGNVRHSLTPCLPCSLLETRSTCLFPTDFTNCYHRCRPFSRKG